MKNYFATIDTETTQDGMVADFASTISDKRGNIVARCAVLVRGIYDAPAEHPLFFDSTATSSIWSRAGQDKRYRQYQTMLDNGSRMLASVPAINSWLAKAAGQYSPILTAYNLPFDLHKCQNTGIDLAVFDRHFCLWSAAYTHWAKSKAYRAFALSCHAFNTPTEKGNMTFKTNAETMARFVLGNPMLEDEPHTALEDIIFYELPILNKLLRRRSVKWLLNELEPYSWQDVQVRDWFKPI